MKNIITKILLKLLNKLNKTPAKYMLVNNIDAYEVEFLESSARQEPDITLSQFMKEMALFNTCPINSVIQGGEVRLMTNDDVKDLQDDFMRESVISEMKKRNEKETG